MGEKKKRSGNFKHTSYVIILHNKVVNKYIFMLHGKRKNGFFTCWACTSFIITYSKCKKYILLYNMFCNSADFFLHIRMGMMLSWLKVDSL